MVKNVDVFGLIIDTVDPTLLLLIILHKDRNRKVTVILTLMLLFVINKVVEHKTCNRKVSIELCSKYYSFQENL